MAEAIVVVDMGREMTDSELAAIEARAKRATEGPWTIKSVWTDKHSGADEVSGANGQSVCLCDEHDGGYNPNTQRNVDFIAHARTDIPALIAEIRRLRADMQDVINGNPSHSGMSTEIGQELYSTLVNRVDPW